MSNSVTILCRSLQMTATKKAVLMCLADSAGDDGAVWARMSVGLVRKWTCLSHASVIRAIRALEDMEILKVNRPGNGKRSGMVLDIDRLNQCHGDTGITETPVSQRHPTSITETPEPVSQRHPITEEHKEHKKREQLPAKKTRIPDDWKPTEKMIAWAHEKRPDLGDLGSVIENFRDHHIAKGEARASWDASFRFWVRNERTSGTKRSRHTGFTDLNYEEKA